MKKPTVSFQNTATLRLLIAFGLAFSAIGFSQAAENGPGSKANCKPAIWPQVKMLAEECLEQRASGDKCDSIVFSNARSASFEIQGSSYKVELTDSELSDGGDLNDVLIDRDDGCTFELRNIPAFGDLLQALASVKSR